MGFEPDYRYVVEAATNKKPRRLPLFEPFIAPQIMGAILGVPLTWDMQSGSHSDLREYVTAACRFYKEMTYDTVTYQVGLIEVLPGHGAIYGGKPGPIQTRADFEKYPWGELAGLFKADAERKFDALCECLPAGMRGIGGIGYGPFETSQDLVGLVGLSYMLVDDPELFAEIFRRLGDLFVELWTWFLGRYGQHWCVCMMSDDLGYKTGTMLSPETIVTHFVPQYRRIVACLHKSGKPVLFHSCGHIFDVMDDIIGTGIDAKHSNEDVVAPFERWIENYGERVGLFGGIDLDFLCQGSADEVYETVLEKGARYRKAANGYVLGSGNSIPEYTPVENYLAMIRAAQKIREMEGTV